MNDELKIIDKETYTSFKPFHFPNYVCDKHGEQGLSFLNVQDNHFCTHCLLEKLIDCGLKPMMIKAEN